MSSALIVCGPTSTGKTKLSLKLAQIIPSELISSDSRQFYKGMDIGTGKDLPSNSMQIDSDILFNNQPIPYFQINNTKLWGYDLAQPDEDIAVAHYHHLVLEISNKLFQSNHLPIIVGGSGLYINALLEPPNTLGINADKDLRKRLSSLSVIQLQDMLREIDVMRFKQLNNSDINNPRRLIRAIEISNHPPPTPLHAKPVYSSTLKIGLTAPLEYIDNQIAKRVQQRVDSGFESEVKTLIRLFPKWNSLPAFTATGYIEWRQYIEGVLSKQAAIDRWIIREKQYARRQITWFKKQNHIRWFDISDDSAQVDIVDLVKNWYSK